MKPADTQTALIALNLLAATASAATGQHWWVTTAAMVAGTLTALTMQGSGILEMENQPGTGHLAAREFLILIACLSLCAMGFQPIAVLERALGLLIQMAAIGRQSIFAGTNQPPTE